MEIVKLIDLMIGDIILIEFDGELHIITVKDVTDDNLIIPVELEEGPIVPEYPDQIVRIGHETTELFMDSAYLNLRINEKSFGKLSGSMDYPIPKDPEEFNKVIQAFKAMKREVGLLSDGFHTFNDMYRMRMILTAALFNYLMRDPKRDFSIHKSLKHFDGEPCFGGGWFIVCANFPEGQISFHYDVKHWGLFQIPEYDKALFPWDGHTEDDVMNRIEKYILAQ